MQSCRIDMDVKGSPAKLEIEVPVKVMAMPGDKMIISFTTNEAIAFIKLLTAELDKIIT